MFFGGLLKLNEALGVATYFWRIESFSNCFDELRFVADQRRSILNVGAVQDLAGSNIGDDHKEYFSGDMALLASGEDNTMNQF